VSVGGDPGGVPKASSPRKMQKNVVHHLLLKQSPRRLRQEAWGREVNGGEELRDVPGETGYVLYIRRREPPGRKEGKKKGGRKTLTAEKGSKGVRKFEKGRWASSSVGSSIGKGSKKIEDHQRGGYRRKG